MKFLTTKYLVKISALQFFFDDYWENFRLQDFLVKIPGPEFFCESLKKMIFGQNF